MVAFGVVVHDVFGEEGTVVLAEAELIEDALFAGCPVLFRKHLFKVIENRRLE